MIYFAYISQLNQSSSLTRGHLITPNHPLRSTATEQASAHPFRRSHHETCDARHAAQHHHSNYVRHHRHALPGAARPDLPPHALITHAATMDATLVSCVGSLKLCDNSHRLIWVSYLWYLWIVCNYNLSTVKLFVVRIKWQVLRAFNYFFSDYELVISCRPVFFTTSYIVFNMTHLFQLSVNIYPILNPTVNYEVNFYSITASIFFLL